MGYSGGKEFNPEATEIAVRALLRQLDSSRVIVSSGATNIGLPEVVYRVAHELGFQTLGITSLKAGGNEPARMDYLLNSGNEWGHESDLFVQSSDILVAIGGKNQTYLESAHAFASRVSRGALAVCAPREFIEPPRQRVSPFSIASL